MLIHFMLCVSFGSEQLVLLSSASTYSCSTSVAGDDRSSISSSSSSQSDTSYGSRLPYWAEPLARLHLSSETVSSSATLSPVAGSDERLHASAMGGPGTRPSSAQLHSRGLHDSGRQSSLDSGIGIAAGSQSSYSGSFSSCTGSLDAGSQGGGEEFGSVVSLPAPPSSPPSAPPPTPPSSPPPVQPTATPEPSSAPSPSPSPSPWPCASSRSSSRACRRHSEEYQSPGLLMLRYDTPRSLLHPSPAPPAQAGQPEPGWDGRSGSGLGQRWSNSPTELRWQRQAMLQRSLSWGSERAPSVDSEGRSTPKPLQAAGGRLCEGAQVQASQVSHSFISTFQTVLTTSPVCHPLILLLYPKKKPSINQEISLKEFLMSHFSS